MSDVVHVTNAAELAEALEIATGGERIELEPGEYEDLYFSQLQYDSTVTITSSDPSNLANIRSLALVSSTNIHLDNLFFDYDPDENTLSYSSAVEIDRSENITLSNSKVEGGPSIIGVPQDVERGEQGAEGILGLPNGRGITVISSNDVLLENNEVSEFFRGIILAASDNVEVIGNEVHHTRASTLAGGRLNDILVEGNYFHSANPWNFGGAGDHGDYVFFWTGQDQTEPSENIIIRNNIADQGDGDPLLGIILGDRSIADVGFVDSEISGNVVNNGHLVSISADIADGLTIRENTLIQSSGTEKAAPQILIDSFVRNAVVEENITYGIIDRTPPANKVQIRENLIIQGADPDAENYLGNLFVNSEILSGAGINFKTIPGSPAAGRGSPLTQFDLSPEELSPHFQVYSGESSEKELILDASLTVGPSGLVSDDKAQFIWDFGDGTTGSGQVVRHEFSAAGHYKLLLTVIEQDGTIARAHFSASIGGNDIVEFNSDKGVFEIFAFGEEATLDGVGLPQRETAEGHVLELGGDGSQARVAKEHLSRFFGTEEFEVNMSLKADSAASWGEIARIHMSFTAVVDQDGIFAVTLFPENGDDVTIRSTGVAVNDGNWHDVTVRFDGEAQFAELIVDGQTVGSKSILGPIGGGGSALYFGNPWGKQSFDGELSAFSLSANSRDFPVYDGETEPASSPSDTQAGVDDNGTVMPPTQGPDSNHDTDVPVTDYPEADDDAVLPDNISDPVEEEDSGSLPPPPSSMNLYALNLSTIEASETIRHLHDDAKVVETEHGSALSFDGVEDHVTLGRLTEFETSQKLAFSVDFTSDNADGGSERLVWNHYKVGLTLQDDKLQVHAGNNDDPFWKGFLIDNMELRDGNLHRVTVMVDAEADRLQVLVDDVLALDEQDTDFDFVGAGGHEWGWSLGTAWNRWFEGEVHDFQISDDFGFVEQSPVDDGLLSV